MKEHSAEIKRLNAELDGIKHKLYEKKSKEQKEKQKIREANQLTALNTEGPSHPKVLGGGFNMGL